MNNIILNENEILDFKNKFSVYLKDNNNPYIKYFFQGNGFSVSIYESGKVVFQGSDLSLFKDYIDVSYNELIDYDLYNTIGADEVGTGDSFGPIVCAACFVPKDEVQYLIELGIKDSKKISDDKILELGKELIKYKHKAVVLEPIKYNQITNKYNMNEIKAILHDKNFNDLSKEVKYDYCVLDEFVNKEKYFSYLKENAFKNISFEMKGESKSIAVASASIIARYYFLKCFNELNIKYNLNLPKGSSIDAIKYIEYLKNNNKEDILKYIAKLNFKSFN